MKSFLFPIVAGLLILSSSLGAQQRLKIATVKMEKLFNEYHKTAEVQRDVNIERARIQKDNNNKLSGIREIDARLQEIRDQLSSANLGEKQRRSLNEESRRLAQDGKSKERERTEYLERKNRALTEKMRKKMRGILVEIQRSVNERAKEGNYDFILDASGKSNQGIPFVIHARETTDLTDSLIEEINEGSGKGE